MKKKQQIMQFSNKDYKNWYPGKNSIKKEKTNATRK